jgi:hypothetical protein
MKRHASFFGRTTALVMDTVCAESIIITSILHGYNPRVKILIEECLPLQFPPTSLAEQLEKLSTNDRVLYIASSDKMDEFLLKSSIPPNRPLLVGVLVRQKNTGWPNVLRENNTCYGKRVNLIVPVPFGQKSLRQHILDSFEYWDEISECVLKHPRIASEVQRIIDEWDRKSNHTIYEILTMLLHQERLQ